MHAPADQTLQAKTMLCWIIKSPENSVSGCWVSIAKLQSNYDIPKPLPKIFFFITSLLD